MQGFKGFQLRRGVEDNNRFLLTVDWDSVEDHQAWQAAHVEEFLGVAGPHIEGLRTSSTSRKFVGWVVNRHRRERV